MQWRMEVILSTVQYNENSYGFWDSHQRQISDFYLLKVAGKKGVACAGTSRSSWTLKIFLGDI